MAFAVSAALLDALVLRVVDQGDSYGYEISQILREKMGISDSTLYPVLRRLLKDQYLESYDVPISGRNRRYYRITAQGRKMLKSYLDEWISYRDCIESILLEGEKQ